MEKPDVLSEEQFSEWCQAHQKQCTFQCITKGILLCRLEAQRDDTYMRTRQDTAREIFEEIEKRLPITNEWYVKDLIQELKSKFLIPPNPVGAGDV